MRLALADLKKSIARRDGEQYVTPYLLRPRERLEELAALIALYEDWLGRARASFPVDRAAEIIGDYRLARCLTLCLSEWYIWESPQWPGPASDDEAQALAAQGIASPGELRLALYAWVNATAGGYLSADEREARLDEFAGVCVPGGVRRATLDALLTLDADDRASLRRQTEQAPTVRELAARYNQRAFETMLANAAQVEWRIPPEAADGSGGGLGAVVKRVCFLSRRMGVLYEVAFEHEQPALAEEDDSAPVALARVAERPALYAVPSSREEPTTLDQANQSVMVTLYGPQEVMSAPAHYGERLARLCRALLGYRRAPDAETDAALAGAGLQGAARVYVYGRPMTFRLDDRLLRLLRVSPSDGRNDTFASGEDQVDDERSGGAVTFDSSLERRLYADFTALERAGETAGWRIEREPEPLLIDETILIPDFALTRDSRRVYLEVAGYWRPGYRERKARKLAALRGAAALVVAAPESARSEFVGLDDAFPFLWYRDGKAINAAALVGVITRAYDDFAARLASLDAKQIAQEVALRGRIPPTESMALLRCYTRAEVAEALRRLQVNGADVVWIDGVGLCSQAWRAALLGRLLGALNVAGGHMPLGELRAALASVQPGPADLTDEATETLAWQAGASVMRASLFAAEVYAPGEQEHTEVEGNTNAPEETPAPQRAKAANKAQTKRAPRRLAGKSAYTVSSLFGEEGEDSLP